nr:hypothetical protein [Escherichia coli]
MKFVFLADWHEILDVVSEEVLLEDEHHKIEESDLTRYNRMLSFPCAKRLVEYFMSSSDYYPTGCSSIADYGFLQNPETSCLKKEKGFVTKSP